MNTRNSINDALVNFLVFNLLALAWLLLGLLALLDFLDLNGLLALLALLDLLGLLASLCLLALLSRAVERQKLNQTTPYGVVWLSFWCSTYLP